eukprot:m.244534 g.244534  ORF g.244534 m.244534 type:complete len:314 (+) comp40247_c1_seq31:2783-3724(+)
MGTSNSKVMEELEKKLKDAQKATRREEERAVTAEQKVKQAAKRKAEEENLKERVRKAEKSVLGHFDHQQLLLIGHTGSGKSSVINSFDFVANLAANSSLAEYQHWAKIGAGHRTKTVRLLSYGSSRGLYKHLGDDLRDKGPVFRDTCGLPERSILKDLIKGIAEGAVADHTNLHALIEKISDCKYEKPRKEKASWVVIFVVSAHAALGDILISEINEAVKKLVAEDREPNVFVLVTKLDLLDKEEDREKRLREFQEAAATHLNITESDVMPLYNFTCNDEDEDGVVKPVRFKQLSVLNAFRKILACSNKPEWV